jgi:hypothetical protein
MHHPCSECVSSTKARAGKPRLRQHRAARRKPGAGIPAHVRKGLEQTFDLEASWPIRKANAPPAISAPTPGRIAAVGKHADGAGFFHRCARAKCSVAGRFMVASVLSMASAPPPRVAAGLVPRDYRLFCRYSNTKSASLLDLYLIL